MGDRYVPRCPFTAEGAAEQVHMDAADKYDGWDHVADELSGKVDANAALLNAKLEKLWAEFVEEVGLVVELGEEEPTDE